MRVSIIIPNYNGRDLLAKNLPQVIESTRPGDEIIVVDDASTDDSISSLKSNFPRVKIIRHKTNQRFAASCNEGVKMAEADIVILLNSDVQPTKGFIKPLLKHFEDPLVFAVGCKEIQEINGVKKESGRAGGAFRRGFLIHWRCDDQSKPTTLWAAGGSAAFRKSFWVELGGMDTLYKPAYWEDIDLSYRALKHGYKVLFEPQSIVYHHHETTNVQAIGRQKMQIAAYKNQILFIWKNITDNKFLFQHFLWLPYHLTLTTIKTNGKFLLGFLAAIRQMPQALNSRKQQNMLYSDYQILNQEIGQHASTNNNSN